MDWSVCVCWKRPKIEIGGVLPKAPERRGQDNPIFHKNNYYSIIFIYIYIYIYFFFDNLYYIIIFIYLPVVCCIFFIFLLMFLFLTYKVWALEWECHETSLNLRIFQKTASLFYASFLALFLFLFLFLFFF